jgi:hypothetical protein
MLKGVWGFWRHGSIWWLGAPSGPPEASWKAFVRRCCMAQVTLLHLHRRFACRNQRSCLRAYGAWLISSAAQAASAAAGPPYPVPGWVGMVWVVLLRVCLSLHPLQTLLCAAFCALEAVVSGLLPFARDQLVPVDALDTCCSNGACCLQLRALDTYGSALGRSCPSCGRGCCICSLHLASLLRKSLR